MIVELPRQEFWINIERTDFSFGEWSAVCFLLSYKDRKRLNLPINETEQLIELVKEVFTDFNDGFFIRSDWTSYLACIKNDKEIVRLGFDKSTAKLSQRNKQCHLWIYNIVNIDKNPVEVIRELEWKTYKGIKL
ncbi:MAG: hypothetical protein ABI904_05230 [Chloroflexota bacterium]